VSISSQFILFEEETNHISYVMVIMLGLSSRSRVPALFGSIQTLKLVFAVATKHTALRSKIKDGLVQKRE
jgi:hypothetical protein